MELVAIRSTNGGLLFDLKYQLSSGQHKVYRDTYFREIDQEEVPQWWQWLETAKANPGKWVKRPE